MFEMSFRDERYLHFEGAGAVSHWRIDLPKDCNAFDFDTLSDVVLRVSYTARDGGAPLAKAARASLGKRRKAVPGDAEEGAAPMTPMRRLFRVRYEFSDAWIAFRNALGTGDATLALTVDQERFPYLLRGARITLVTLRAYMTLTTPIMEARVDVTPPQGEPVPLTFGPSPTDPTLLRATTEWNGEEDVKSGTWKFSATPAAFPAGQIKDLLLLFTYTIS
jgi:hypothetical protein